MKIIWTDFAIQNLKLIFNYYSENANKKIAHKIRIQILASTSQLKNHSESGQKEFYLEKLKENHRYIISGNYKIIYKIIAEGVLITDVFDVRQNPDSMNDEKRVK